MSDLVDQVLLDGLVRGDAAALGKLYDLFAPKAYAIACRVLAEPHDAEEVVQEAFLDLWRHATRYDPRRASVLGWLITLTRTRAIDRLRSLQARERASEKLSTQPTGSAPDPELAAAMAQSAELMKALIAELPKEQRESIELAYWEGLSQSDIAARTGAPLGTVKTRMRLAMTKLAQGSARASRI